MPKYRDVYPLTLEGTGLIFGLSIMPNIPWSAMTLEEKQALEMSYGVRSGFKNISNGFLAGDDSVRVRILLTLYRDKWQKLWDRFHLEYNPLDAYKVVEEGNNSKVVSGTKTSTFGRTVTENGSNKSNRIADETSNGQATENIYGLDSIGGSPANSSSETSHNDSTENRTNETTNETKHGGSDAIDMKEDEKNDHRLTKSGNIGYTSPQSLLKQEFELWKDTYFNIVFSDIDSFITVQVYSV